MSDRGRGRLVAACGRRRGAQPPGGSAAAGARLAAARARVVADARRAVRGPAGERRARRTALAFQSGPYFGLSGTAFVLATSVTLLLAVYATVLSVKPRPCERCRGVGGAQCFVCDGSGRTFDSARAREVKCRGCFGRGLLLCRRCRGRGYVNNYFG